MLRIPEGNNRSDRQLDMFDIMSYKYAVEDNTIDIDNIEEVNHYNVISAIEGKTEENIDDELGKYSLVINKLLQAVKQLNKEIKELKER